MIMVWIALGGAIGSAFRYLLSQALEGSAGLFPLGTIAVNILGSLFLGGLFAAQEHFGEMIKDSLWLFLTVGLCGGFTTFSTFGLETYLLWKEKHVVEAILYMLSSMVVAPASIAAGYVLVKSIQS